MIKVPARGGRLRLHIVLSKTCCPDRLIRPEHPVEHLYVHPVHRDLLHQIIRCPDQLANPLARFMGETIMHVMVRANLRFHLFGLPKRRGKGSRFIANCESRGQWPTSRRHTCLNH